MAALRKVVAPSFPVSFRMSQWKGGAYDARLAESPQELERILTPLVEAGVDVFHASTRRYWQPEFDDSDLNLAGWIKKITGRPVITVGSVGLDMDVDSTLAGQTPSAMGIDQLLERLERDEFDLALTCRIAIPNRSTEWKGESCFSLRSITWTVLRTTDSHKVWP